MSRISADIDNSNILEFKRERTKRKVYDLVETENIQQIQQITKKPKIDNTSIQWANVIKPSRTDIWVSGTMIKNYMMNDPIIDWLENYWVGLEYNQSNKPKQMVKTTQPPSIKSRTEYLEKEMGKMNILLTSGIKFENAVFAELTNRFGSNCVKVVDTHDEINEQNYKKTLNLMKRHVPIIMQAVLLNPENKTRGLADLLVRSDYLNKICNKPQIEEEQVNIPAPLINSKYHYQVIDIKWTMLHLCSDGKLLRNDGRIPAYKGQLAIYSSILGKMQGYYPPTAWLLGHSWKYEIGSDKCYGFSCFDRLGCINYKNFDANIINKTAQAIEWVRKVKTIGNSWSVLPASVPELHPNMSNTNDAPWAGIKKRIAIKSQEITQLWHVGFKHRAKAHEKNILTWSDPLCSSENLGINGKKSGILNSIIKVNKDKKAKLLPNIIENNLMGWQNESGLDFYIDFETVNGCFMGNTMDLNNSKTSPNMIFMIGIGYIENSKWAFKEFTAQELNLQNEQVLIDLMVNFINKQIDSYRRTNRINPSRKLIPRFFHWANAEVTSLSQANQRNKFKWTQWIKQTIWIDLCKVFQAEPIVVKGAFSFKLKDIAKNMYTHRMIKTTWSDEISDGLNAMIDAIRYYGEKKSTNNPGKYSDVIQSIKSYNEVDCKVMWEILDYLRTHHI